MALADAIASINRTLEIVQKRMVDMEEKRAETESRQAAVLAAIEEKRNSDLQQLLAKMEKLSTAITESQRMFEKTAGTQTTHPNPPILPTPPPNPQPITTIIPQPPGSSAKISQQPPYENSEKHLRTTRLEVPVFSGEAVDGWLFQLECYFEINDVRPEQMVKTAPLFMTGEALRWYLYKHLPPTKSPPGTQLATDARRWFGYGLSNAPSCFQAEINLVFKALIRRSMLVFFYDILLNGANMLNHLRNLMEVFDILRLHSFYVKPAKCDIARTTVGYLGHVISYVGMAVGLEKIEAVMKWLQPQNLIQLCGFLGLTRYYKHFVRHYASLADALSRVHEPQVQVDENSSERTICIVTQGFSKHEYGVFRSLKTYYMTSTDGQALMSYGFRSTVDGKMQYWFDENESRFLRNYFMVKELGGSRKKSVKKVSDIGHVDEQELPGATAENEVKHKKVSKKLIDEYLSSFSDWLFELRFGFGHLIYGFGSKKGLLEDFASTSLVDYSVFVINGNVKTKKVKVKVTLAEAAAKIDASELSVFLLYVTCSFQNQDDIQMKRLADYIGCAFARVGSALNDIQMKPSFDKFSGLIVWNSVMPLCDPFICPEAMIVTACLEGLENMLMVGEEFICPDEEQDIIIEVGPCAVGVIFSGNGEGCIRAAMVYFCLRVKLSTDVNNLTELNGLFLVLESMGDDPTSTTSRSMHTSKSEDMLGIDINFILYVSSVNKVGEEGYGPGYKAILDKKIVAIKILKSDISQGVTQFQQEVEVLGRMRHPNRVLLVGACPEYGCLVYVYMENGSLEDWLFRKDNSSPLSWQARFRIAAEISTALLYLHLEKPEPLVHCDLKPATILLDHNYIGLISDVCLARLLPAFVSNATTQYHMTAAAGTFCYIGPEYQQTGMLRMIFDVYTLGVMLLQIIIYRSPMGLTHQIETTIENGTFESMLDPAMRDWPVEEALSFAKLALRFCELRKKDIPDLAHQLVHTVIKGTWDSWFNYLMLKLPQGCRYEFQMHYGSIGWSVGVTLGYAHVVNDLEDKVDFKGRGMMENDICNYLVWAEELRPIFLVLEMVGIRM